MESLFFKFFESQQEKCHELIEKGEFYNSDQQSCTPLWYETIDAGGGFNAYDYRLFGLFISFCFFLLKLRGNNISFILGGKKKQKQVHIRQSNGQAIT